VAPEFTGRIAEWDPVKGCGWLESDGQRIFLHRRDFAQCRKRPTVGDVIRFSAGTGPTGLLCAQRAVHLNDGGHLSLRAAACLLPMLALPALAIAKLPIDSRITCGYAVLVSVGTYVAYARDKAKARDRRWRTPEATLHFIELFGGWPGAFIAQRRLRHKCSKVSYQIVFWVIVVAYQYVAVDFLQQWRLSRLAAEIVTTIASSD